VFYSLVGLLPMYARPGAKTPIFYYQTKGRELPLGALSGGGGEGVVHELAKLHIALKKQVVIKITEIKGEAPAMFTLSFETIDMEVPRNINGTIYGIDLLGQLRADSPLIEPWGKEIAIEIRDRHAVTRRKHKDLQAINLTTVEIKLQKGMHLTHEQESDRSLIEDRRRWITHFFAKPVWAKVLHRRDYMELRERRKSASAAKALVRPSSLISSDVVNSESSVSQPPVVVSEPVDSTPVPVSTLGTSDHTDTAADTSDHTDTAADTSEHTDTAGPNTPGYTPGVSIGARLGRWIRRLFGRGN
jgi:hypothetical protein